MIGMRTFLKLDCKYLGQERIQGVTWVTSHPLYFTKTSQNCIIRKFFIIVSYKNWHIHWKSNASNQIATLSTKVTPWKFLDAPMCGSFRTLYASCHHLLKIFGSAFILVELRNNMSKIITNFQNCYRTYFLLWLWNVKSLKNMETRTYSVYTSSSSFHFKYKPILGRITTDKEKDSWKPLNYISGQMK